MDRSDYGPYGELPQTVETEVGLLGALFLHNKTLDVVRPLVNPEDFFDPLTAAVYAAMCDLREGGSTFTSTLIAARLGDVDLEGQKLSAILARWAASAAATTGEAPHYAQMIREYADRRRVIVEAMDLAKNVRDPRSKLKNEVERQISHLDGILMSHNVSTAARPKAMTLDEILLDAQDPSRKPKGVTTGFVDLDRMTGGYNAGDLWVLGGRASMGKSTISVSSARQTAAYQFEELLKSGTANGVLFLTMEMSAEQTYQRLLTDLAFGTMGRSGTGIAYSKFRPDPTTNRAAFTDSEIARLADAAHILKRIPIEVDGRPGMTVPDVGSRVRKAKDVFARRGAPLRLVVCDHIGKMEAVKNHNGSKVNEIGEITGGLKAIAMNEGVCVLAMNQLSRAVEGRENKRPQISDFRDSGHIEQDADIIGGLYRHDYYVQRGMIQGASGDEFADELELHILKNRLGAVGQVDLFVEMAASAVRNGQKGGFGGDE